MPKYSTEERQLLAAAKRLRRLVKADVEKTANPALALLIRALGPTFLRVGPKVFDMVKNVPASAWGHIASGLIQLISQAAQTAMHHASSETLSVEPVAKALRAAKFENPDETAELLVRAATEAALDHISNPDPKLGEAIEAVRVAQAEASLIREFM